MTKTVLYFLAGNVPTTGEAADLAKIAAAGPSYVCHVRNGGYGSTNYGAGPESADYVAGTPPAAYANTTTYPRLDPTNIPVQNLLATQAVITSATDFTVAGVVFHPVIAGGIITALTHTP
jgi:hypothetical protein